MNPRKRLLDLKKRDHAPLDLARAKRRDHRHILHLDQAGRSRSVAFDLQQSKQQQPEEGIYLAEPQRPSRLPRLVAVAGALVLVLGLNLVGVFGEGKATVERVVGTAMHGVEQLTAAGHAFAAGEFLQSHTEFSAALAAFASAENDIARLGGAGAVLATKPESVQSGSRLVTAGKLIASSGQHFAAAGEQFAVAAATWEGRQRLVAAKTPVSSFSTELSGVIREALAGFAELESAAAVLDLVEVDSLPASLQGQVRDARSQLGFIRELAQPYLAVLPQIPDILGDRVPRRYLILFQNQDEIRPTGGFIGSVGVLTLNDGFVQNFDIEDVYEVDGQLAERLDPPEGFGFITDRWGLRDANYHPDFPTSAEAASWLFEQAGRGTVDGVIAVTADMLTRAVELTDGVELTRFGRVPAEDIQLLLSMIIETKLDGAAAPKQILRDVWDSLQQQLADVPPADLVQAARDSLAAGEVQAWFDKPDFQAVAQAFGVAGELKISDSDYLAVIDTSLSGNKSDRYTSNTITHETDISAAGQATNTLRISRNHGWNSDAERELDRISQEYSVPLPDSMKEILGRGRNIDLMKIFVPAGSQLLTVQGVPSDRIETHESAGLTYFMLSLTVKPGTSRDVVLKYSVPGDFAVDYSLQTVQQVGAHATDITKIVRRDGEEVLSQRETVTADRLWQ